MISSPTNLSSVPWYLKITSTISSKYSLSMRTISCGARFSLMAVKPRMSENSAVTSCRAPPFSSCSLPATTWSTRLGDSRRWNWARVLASCSILRASSELWMATAAWLAMPANSCRSFSPKASVATMLSRCMTPSSSSWWTSGTVMVERMPCMMIEWAPEKRLSIEASADSTAVFCCTTSVRIDRRQHDLLVAAVAGAGDARAWARPSSISRITPRSAGISSKAFMMIFSSSRSRFTSRPMDRRSSWASRSFS